jgi:hypothetical protein
MPMNLRLRKITAWPLCLAFLFGAMLSANGEVLCLGDNGHFELETYCPPCCNESEDSCEAEIPDDQHSEHNDCSNCLDIELGDLFWYKINSIGDSEYILGFSYYKFPISYNSVVLVKDISSYYNRFLQLDGVGPPSISAVSTVLRC